MKRDLWSLVSGTPQVDPDDLAEAIQGQIARPPLDFRTRLLIRDGVDALESHWGTDRLRRWLAEVPLRDRLESVWRESLGEAGFPSLKERLMEKTEPETIRQYLRELSTSLSKPVTIHVGGCIAMILQGVLERKTEDVDIVDEVPEPLRSQHQMLANLQKRYGLHLGHFQRHYLAMRWEQRVHSTDPMGNLRLYLLDPHDVFVSKLFSIREKDIDDLRVAATKLSKEHLTRILQDDCKSVLVEPSLKERAEKNWFIIFGEPLPS